jgi:hypothetical protein
MGGGTAIVEALAAGRTAIGFDINALALFVSSVKTAPLSQYDESSIGSAFLQPVETLTVSNGYVHYDSRKLKNVPYATGTTFRSLLSWAASMYLPRQERFARCMVLRLGQWALDSRVNTPSEAEIIDTLHEYVYEMLDGLREFVGVAREHGVAKNRITKRRLLLQRSIIGAEQDPRLSDMIGRPRLVITSPPYPGVHVLYHRWQVGGRRETPAPYWFIGGRDGNSASYYTMGSRTPFGWDNYFTGLTAAFRSVRAIVHPEALVVQLVAFADVERQLPRFLAAMEEAGFCEVLPKGLDRAGYWRDVPNRKWYNRTSAVQTSAQELLLFHRLCTGM